MKHKQHGQMKNQLRMRKSGMQEQSSSMGGREFGQVIEPMQAEMASGNEGLAEQPMSQEKKMPRNRKKAA